MTSVGIDSEAAAKLRDEMVGELIDDGVITSETVESAMRAVPRHLFTPDASLDEAYRPYDSVVTVRDAAGRALSSVSAPQLQAFMLEQAGIEPGMRVLEVGSGGYNAARRAGRAGRRGHQHGHRPASHQPGPAATHPGGVSASRGGARRRRGRRPQPGPVRPDPDHCGRMGRALWLDRATRRGRPAASAAKNPGP